MFQRRLLLSLSLILWSVIRPSFGLPLAARSFAPDAASLSSRLAAIEKAVEEKRQELHVPGVSLVIVKDDQAVLMKGFGEKDVEHHLPVTADTLFAIGSCTKAFTGLAAMIAVDEGKLSLDDSPKKYLPYFKLADPEADAKVTLRDLLCHRTGLPSDNGRFWADGKRNREEVIKAGMLVKPTAKLREKFQYNNIMYAAAGEAVAKALNSTWEEVIAHRIFKPLGMTASNTTIQEMQQSPDYALGYEHASPRSKIKPLKLFDLRSVAPAGAINSNAKDMAEWLRLMLAGGAINGQRLVSEKGFAEIVSKQMPVKEDVSYGLGWGVATKDGHRLLTHTGGVDNFSSLVELMPDEKLGWAILVNVNDLPKDDLKPAIRKIVLDNLVAKAGEPQAASNSAPASESSPPNSKAAETKSTEALPTIEQVLDKYVQALGGKAAIQAPTSRVMKGTLAVADIEAKGTIEVDAKAPNKELTEIASAAWGNSRTGFNGTVGWEEENGEVKELPHYPKRQADFYLPLKLREFFPRLDLKGKEKIGEREAYCLEAPRSGNPKRWYFDTNTGLLLRTEAKNPDGQLLNREDYEDYRAVNGMKIPFTVRRVEEAGIEIVIKYSEIKHNVPIDDAKFEKPAAKSPTGEMQRRHLTEAVRGRLQGAPGTNLRIVYLDGQGQVHEAAIACGQRKTEMYGGILRPVDFDTRRLAGGIGYLRFSPFTPSMNARIHAAVLSLKDAPGLVIDLRGNPGGDGSVGLKLANLLCSQPTLYQTTRLRGGVERFTLHPPAKPYTGPVVILLDPASGSASEQFSASLQELGRATIIGERTPGAVLDAAGEKLPTGALFLYAYGEPRTPQGVVTEGRGVIPGIEVKLTRANLLRGGDPQLEAAINYRLQEKEVCSPAFRRQLWPVKHSG